LPLVTASLSRGPYARVAERRVSSSGDFHEQGFHGSTMAITANGLFVTAKPVLLDAVKGKTTA
jgi:hypothetical protein